MEKRNNIFMGDQKIHAGNVFLFFLYRFFSCKEEINFHCFL